MKKNSPPMIAAIARIPTTTPAAMAATFGLVPVSPPEVGLLDGVTDTVCAGAVMTDALVDVVAAAVLVVVELDSAEAVVIGILFKSPES